MKFYINHFNFNVTNLDKSIAFYHQHFGLNEVRRKDGNDDSFTLVYLADETKQIYVELTWLKNKKGVYNLGDNESHLAFMVDNYEEALKQHQAAGIVCFVNTIMGIYFVEDPDGYWVEVVPKRIAD